MKTFKIYLLLILGMGLFLNACNKDDEEVSASREELISGEESKSWKITGAEGKLLNDEYSSFTIDFYNGNKIYSGGQEIPSEWIPSELQNIPSFPECAKDNLIVFRSDHTYEANEGTTSCNTPSEFILTKGTWSLSDNEQKLILADTSGAEIEYTLTEVSAKSITGENSGSLTVDGTQVDYTLITTFTAQ